MKAPTWRDCNLCQKSFFSNFERDHHNACAKDDQNQVNLNFPYFSKSTRQFHTFLNVWQSEYVDKLFDNIEKNRLLFVTTELAECCDFKSTDFLSVHIPRTGETYVKKLCPISTKKNQSTVYVSHLSYDSILNAEKNETVIVGHIKPETCCISSSITLDLVTIPEMEFVKLHHDAIMKKIQEIHSNFFYSPLNRFFIEYLDKLLIFEIVKSSVDVIDGKELSPIFQTTSDTIWRLHNFRESQVQIEKPFIVGLEAIVEIVNGLLKMVSERRNELDARVVVIHGRPGWGKSQLCNYFRWLAQDSDIKLKDLSKTSNAENILKSFDQCFQEVLAEEDKSQRQIVLIDDFDEKIKTRESKKHDILPLIKDFLENANLKKLPILLIATVKDPKTYRNLNSMIIYKFEIPRMDFDQRVEMLKYYVEKFFLEITDDELKNLAFYCLPFGAVDFKSVVTRASGDYYLSKSNDPFPDLIMKYIDFLNGTWF